MTIATASNRCENNNRLSIIVSGKRVDEKINRPLNKVADGPPKVSPSAI